MTTSEKFLVWMDLETTGLEDNCAVLEVAAILTDTDLKAVGEPLHIIRQATPDILGKLTPFVFKMHSANGLLAEAIDARLLTDSDIDVKIVRWLRKSLGHVKPGAVFEPYPPIPELYLAGAGVSHYDHDLIKRRLPVFARTLRYATIDVSVIRRFEEEVVGLATTRIVSPHRAMPDVLDALALARGYRAGWL